MNVQEKIETFIEENHLSGQPHEVMNTSEVFPGRRNRCYEMRLTREDSRYAYIYAYAGPAIYEMSMADALYNLVDEAEHYGGWTNYNEWNKKTAEATTSKNWAEKRPRCGTNTAVTHTMRWRKFWGQNYMKV